VKLNRNDDFDAVLIRLLPCDISAVRMAAGHEMAWDISCPHYSTLPPLIGAHAFLPSSWGHACCDHESERYRPVDTVLTSRQIRQFSPNFSRTTGSEAIEKWEGKDLFSLPCIEILRGIRPPCPTACSTPCTHRQRQWNVVFSATAVIKFKEEHP